VRSVEVVFCRQREAPALFVLGLAPGEFVNA
jgi:hypothetical protein